MFILLIDQLSICLNKYYFCLQNSDLLDTPIGFAKGVNYEKKSLSKIIGSAGNKSVSVLHLTDLLTQADDIDLGLEDASEHPEPSENSQVKSALWKEKTTISHTTENQKSLISFSLSVGFTRKWFRRTQREHRWNYKGKVLMIHAFPECKRLHLLVFCLNVHQLNYCVIFADR